MMSNVLEFIVQNSGHSGRTTRLANDYIQRFFRRERYIPIFVSDHRGGNDDKLLTIIDERLKHEHGLAPDEYIINYDEHYVIRIYDRQAERRKYLIEDAIARGIRIMSILPEMARATGMTTVLVDEAIERLFAVNGEWITIKDHYGSRQADVMLLEKICKRLEAEHPSVKFEAEKLKCRIRIKKSEE